LTKKLIVHDVYKCSGMHSLFGILNGLKHLQISVHVTNSNWLGHFVVNYNYSAPPRRLDPGVIYNSKVEEIHIHPVSWAVTGKGGTKYNSSREIIIESEQRIKLRRLGDVGQDQPEPYILKEN
jgi:hypothetical protein